MKQAKEKTKETQPKEAAATEAPKENKPTETKPKVIKPSFYDKAEPAPAAEPAESWVKRNHLVMDTEEYKEFISAVKAQGGYCTDTLPARGGVGLSIQYMLPSGRRA